MRALKVLPAILALTLAVPAFAEPAPAGRPPAGAHAKKAGGKDRAAKREARLLEALKKQGIENARAKKVVAVVKKYRTEMKPVHQEAKTHRQNLRRLNEANPKDETAIKNEQAALKTAHDKIGRIRERQVAELNTILTPAERAKVKELMQRGKHKGAKGAKGKKQQTAKKKTQRATG